MGGRLSSHKVFPLPKGALAPEPGSLSLWERVGVREVETLSRLGTALTLVLSQGEREWQT